MTGKTSSTSESWWRAFEARLAHKRFFDFYIAWITICCVVGGATLLYLAAGLRASGGSTPIMPLDDAYIHFQYARAVADGHPFRYNADQPPTSGATSLLYPFILAAGYKLGFQSSNLAWWALLIGIFCWLSSTWLVYKIISWAGQYWIGLMLAIAFALTGSISWAFMSGMETGLMVFGTLLTLWFVNKDKRGWIILAATFTTLIRPEGAVIGGLAVLYLAINVPSWRERLRRLPLYALPLLAALIQPLLNLVLTGAVTASGLQSKSYLYNVPLDSGTITTIIGTYLQIWAQMLTGGGPNSLYYTTLPCMIALFGIIPAVRVVWHYRRNHHLNVPLLIYGWLFALTVFIALLETAFWQFKRYQQPLIALMFPLAAWSLYHLAHPRGQDSKIMRLVVAGLTLLLLGNALLSTRDFLQNYADNVREVSSSQLPMARYVAATIPPGTTVGVHDIGVMRYLGDHPTYDVIGLTTPNAARAWRNGPGAAYEQMLRSPWRPEYFAIYDDARGLTYFSDPHYGLFGDKLASFPSVLLNADNVASATTNGQNVYRADWTFARFADQPHQPASLKAINGLHLIDTINVADLDSEDTHQYRWWNVVQRSGFASEVYKLDYASCTPTADNLTCRILDGGRLITGGEEMLIATQSGQDLLWITRVHPRDAAKLNIFVADQLVGTRLIPAIPGQWIEIATLIPGNLITGTQTRLRVEANITDPAAGHYMPYYHWFYQGRYQADMSINYPEAVATFAGSIKLVGHHLAYNADTRTLTLDLEWQSDSTVAIDAKTFVHLYDQADKLLENAQQDRRPGDGVLPPANWLPGTLRDTYVWAIPESVSPGMYRVKIGLYDPANPTQRLAISGDGSDSELRLLIGSIEVR